MKTLAAIFVAALLALCSISTSIAQSDWQLMKKDQLMAVDEKTLDTAFNMLLENDPEALAQLEMRGRIRLSKGTEKVALEDVKTHWFVGTDKMAVRIKGSTKIWWGMIDAMQDADAKPAAAAVEEKGDH